MRVHSILVPTDFSPASDRALSLATDLARRFGSKLTLAHSYHVPISCETALGGGLVVPYGYYQQLRRHAQERIDERVARTVADGVSCTGALLSGPAPLAIIELAGEIPADLIVIGTRGNSRLRHVLLGSVASRVVREAPCPVMTVKAEASVAQPAEAPAPAASA